MPVIAVSLVVPGVRPYKCESCEKAFTQRCSLESHCRKIHGLALPFSFNERRAKIYVCESCGDSTSSLDSHFQHLRDMHPHHPSLFKHRDRRQFKPSKERSNGVFEGTSDDATEDESSDGNASRTGSEQERSLSHFRTTDLAWASSPGLRWNIYLCRHWELLIAISLIICIYMFILLECNQIVKFYACIFVEHKPSKDKVLMHRKCHWMRDK